MNCDCIVVHPESEAVLFYGYKPGSILHVEGCLYHMADTCCVCLYELVATEVES